MIWITLPVILWVFFLAYADLKRFSHTLRPEVKAVGLIVILIGFLIDVVFNWTIGLLMGITKDLTFSQKCKRLKQKDGLIGKVANYICANWLNPFDGNHC